MITGIHHFSLIVSSEESIAFYEKLGFREYKRINREYDTVVLMEGYGVGIEIFIDPTHPARKKPEPLGLRYLSLKVENLSETLEKLELQASDIMKDWVGDKYCLVTDPDGNVIQMHE